MFEAIAEQHTKYLEEFTQDGGALLDVCMLPSVANRVGKELSTSGVTVSFERR